MAVIVPCITTDNIEEFNQRIETYGAFTDRLHIDVSDGEFAPNMLVSPNAITIPEGRVVDIHVMYARPSECVPALIALKPRLITLHAESSEKIDGLMDEIKKAGIKVGLALLKTTVPKTVKPLIEKADHVMIFSGELGQYGGKASMMQLEKVRLIRMIHPSVEIGWDGGASFDNAFSLSQGDVNVVYVGGAIGKASDPAKAYKELSDEINKHGVM